MRAARTVAAMGRACALALLLALTGTTGMARAQDAAPGPGFGARDSFVLSFERVFGFQTQELGDGDEDPTIDSVGLYPFLWGNVGFFGVEDGGLSYGTTVGVGHLSSPGFDDDATFTLARLGPRIGYAGHVATTPWFGYWLRGGPSFLLAFLEQENENATSFAIAATLEAYAVMTPVPHFGVMLGPHVDIHLYGDAEGEDFVYRSYGLTLGLMGEFW